ncbi:uncharacterized protein V1518DRAFT_370905 [Limtongia smithiae]|uniref:uncharacterized protein n=1 Tax=Limtongia smithiae TaxID=1125753 RepID=UPI0034CE9F25
MERNDHTRPQSSSSSQHLIDLDSEDDADQNLESTAGVWDSVAHERESAPPVPTSTRPVTTTTAPLEGAVPFMCHGCYSHFEAVPNTEFPVLCPRCHSDFCEIIEDDYPNVDFGDEEEDDYGDEHDDYGDEQDYLPDFYYGGRQRNDRERRHTQEVMDMVQMLSNIVHDNRQLHASSVSAAPDGTTQSPSTRLAGNSNTSNPAQNALSFSFTPRAAGQAGDDSEATPMEQLSNFLQQTFASIGLEQPGATPGEGGIGTANRAVPNDIVTNLMGRIFNMTGNVNDYVMSDRQLDQIVSQLMEQAQTNNAPPPAAENDISALPNLEIKDHPDLLKHTSECVICKEQYELSDTVCLLPCKHFFHPTCIKHWLGISDSCPICRHPISPETAAKEGSAADAVTDVVSDSPAPESVD